MPVAPGTFNYYLAPWRWGAIDGPGSEEGWLAPPGTVGLVDLRPTPAQAMPSVAEGFGFFAVDPLAAVPDSGFLLGNNIDGVPSRAVTRGVESRIGLTRDVLATKSVTGLLFDMLTTLADASGDNRVRPLSPTRPGNLDLHLGGHSLIRREQYSRAAHPFVLAKARYDFARLDREGRTRAVMLQAVARKLGVSVQELTTPSGGATWTESFGTVAAADLSVDLTWTEVVQTWQVTENAGDGEAAPSVNATARARAEADTDTDDMYAQVEHRVHGNTALAAASCRYAAAADTMYGMGGRAEVSAFNRDLYKRVTATFTRLAGADTLDTLPATFRVEADGSSIEGFVDGVSVLGPVTDTDISGNTRGGLEGFGTADRYDDFEFGDLAAAVTYREHHALARGTNRGIARAIA